METKESEMNDQTFGENGLRSVQSFDSIRLYDQSNGLPRLLQNTSPTKPPLPALKLAHSAEEPSLVHTRRSKTYGSDRPELARTVSASSNIAQPTLQRKASENAMKLSNSGSPPVAFIRDKRLSRNGNNAQISPNTSGEIPNSNALGSTSNNSNGGSGRFTLMSGAYQRTSQSAGNLILSRPTTPTLVANEGGSPRSGSPDQGMLPRSASDQTPKKKSIEDFHIGKVLGEGSYGAVCSHSFYSFLISFLQHSLDYTILRSLLL